MKLAREIPIMTEIRRRTWRANGIRQFYLEAGTGPPIVLLHGFAETSIAWREPDLGPCARYRVIAPDLRGYEKADKPASGYDKRATANDIVELLVVMDNVPTRIVARGGRRGQRQIG